MIRIKKKRDSYFGDFYIRLDLVENRISRTTETMNRNRILFKLHKANKKENKSEYPHHNYV